jgi:hypothetical protein
MSRDTNTLAAQRLPQSNDRRHDERRFDWPLAGAFVVVVVTGYAVIGYGVYRAVSAFM